MQLFFTLTSKKDDVRHILEASVKILNELEINCHNVSSSH